MASCDSLGQIFETPKLPETPSLVESLTAWNPIQPREPVELSSFSEIFGELHLKEKIGSSSSFPFLASFQPVMMNPGNHESNKNPLQQKNQERSSEGKRAFSLHSMNSESLNMCTEGLGFESFEDVEDGLGKEEKVDDTKKHKEKVVITRHLPSANPYSESRRVRTFPPPIPSIGRNGKPWVSYKSFRCDGRLVLKEIMTSTHGQEFMHACREDGRLTLHLIHRDGDGERAKSELRATKDGTAEADVNEIEQNSKS